LCGNTLFPDRPILLEALSCFTLTQLRRVKSAQWEIQGRRTKTVAQTSQPAGLRNFAGACPTHARKTKKDAAFFISRAAGPLLQSTHPRNSCAGKKGSLRANQNTMHRKIMNTQHFSTRALLLAAVGLLTVTVVAPRAHGQASTVGQWGTTQPFPFISVHGALLPTGKVIIWDYSGNTRLWDPVTTAITTPTQPGRNTFCAGNTLMADGRVFVPGGHIQNNVGLATASYYDPVANTWTSVPNMNAGRWYPSATTLANGDVLVTSGDDNLAVNTLPQVYQAGNNTWRNLS
jgi:hypothetical protein